jgi:hypothetical protein
LFLQKVMIDFNKQHPKASNNIADELSTFIHAASVTYKQNPGGFMLDWKNSLTSTGVIPNKLNANETTPDLMIMRIGTSERLVSALLETRLAQSNLWRLQDDGITAVIFLYSLDYCRASGVRFSS